MKRYTAVRGCDRFECQYLDESGECEPMAGECIGDMCENWKDCGSCGNREECERCR